MDPSTLAQQHVQNVSPLDQNQSTNVNSEESESERDRLMHISLSQVGGSNDHQQRVQPHGVLPMISTLVDPEKRFARRWSSFWKSGINIEQGHARRHIVMSSTIKQTIVAMRGYALDPNTEESLTDLMELYAVRLAHYYQVDPIEGGDLDYLEELLFYTLHNLKFNITIGDTYWNSAISDMASKIYSKERNAIDTIRGATTSGEVYEILAALKQKYMSTDKTFARAAYSDIRKALDTISCEVLMSFEEASQESRSLEQLKEESIEKITALYDSLITDLSSVPDSHLRKWQNSVMVPIHKGFLCLVEHQDFNAYATLLKEFLDTDRAGAEIIGVELNDLNMGKACPGVLSHFQRNITSVEDPFWFA